MSLSNKRSGGTNDPVITVTSASTHDSKTQSNKRTADYSTLQTQIGRTVFTGALNSHYSFSYNWSAEYPQFVKKILSKFNFEVNPDFKFQPYYMFKGNRVTSALYTWYNFIPLQILFQFSKVANIYFLIISLLQQLPGVSPTGQYTTLAPLILFVALAMLREAYDDFKRHLQDNSENDALVEVFKSKFSNDVSIDRYIELLKSVKPTSKDFDGLKKKVFSSVGKAVSFKKYQVRRSQICVGDIVKVNRGEFVPCDMVILTSSIQDGSCYVETKSLDGESTLKQRFAIQDFSQKSIDDLIKYPICIQAEIQNSDLLKFDGYIEYSFGYQKIQRVPVSINELLLRGSTLKRTEYVYGIAIFTGEDSKIRMNAKSTIKAKAPMISSITDRLVIGMFFAILILAAISTGFSVQWLNVYSSQAKYLLSLPDNALSTFITFVILYNTMIPISLYVTMEMIKLAQVFKIRNDSQLADEEGNYAVANTSSLNEDLGQVSYVFSDKTGTLTENVMKFRKFCAGEVIFEPPQNKITGTPQNRRLSIIQKSNIVQGNDVFEYLHSHENQESPAVKLVTAMSLCHAVHTATEQDTMSRGGGTLSRQGTGITRQSNVQVYEAASPDEIAIVNATKELGYEFVDRSHDSVKISIFNPVGTASRANGSIKDFKILNIIDFTSERKRMSVVYRFPDGSIHLICKGADSEMFNRIKYDVNNLVTPSESGVATIDRTANAIKLNIKGFASEGLRTLVYAHKVISENDYNTWSQKYQQASLSIKERNLAMATLADQLERDLEVLGATAIEDQLQDGVQETLDSLRRANIRIWLLTGDMKETAINVGYACQVIKQNSTIYQLDYKKYGNSDSGFQAAVLAMLKEQEDHLNQNSTIQRQTTSGTHSIQKRHTVVVLDGSTFSQCVAQHGFVCIDEPGIAKDLKNYSSLVNLVMRLCEISDSVICCRVSPIQKALIVRYMKERIGKGIVTLAIGDGANDIAMLREAHVGIGIAGREGLQAARASDYYIYRFKFLKRLLLVHGRWSYYRVSKFIMGSFYKCVAFYITQLLFQAYTGVSGTSLYESWTLALYNLAFTSLPVIFIGIFEKDLYEDVLLKYPQIYCLGQKNDSFNAYTITQWIFFAFYHALCLFWIPMSFFGMNQYDISSFLQDDYLYSVGTIVYTAVIFVVNIKVVMVDAKTWTIPTLFVGFLSVVLWFVYQVVYSRIWLKSSFGYQSLGLFENLVTKANYPLIVIVTIAACLLPDICFQIAMRIMKPSKIDLLREQRNQGTKNGNSGQGAPNVMETGIDQDIIQ